MYKDAQQLLSDAQAVTATAASTNILDFGTIRNIGVGETLQLIIDVDVAMTDSGSDSTVTVTIETDDNASFSSATTTRTLVVFAALTAAATQVRFKIGDGDMNERYARLKYTVANGSLTTGSFTAFITKDEQAFTAYPSGYTIS